MSKPKFWKNTILFGWFFILSVALPLKIILVNELYDVGVFALLFLGGGLFGFLFLTTIKKWKYRNNVVEIRNGKLTHFANLKFKKLPIAIVQISEIEISMVGKVKQIVLNLKNEPKPKNISLKGFRKQLNGEVVYITDSLIDSKEFDKLIDYLYLITASD